MWFMDAYRAKDKIVLWIKTKDGHLRIEKPFQSKIYLEPDPRIPPFLRKYNIKHRTVTKTTYIREKKEVIEVLIPSVSQFETTIRWIERKCRHRLPIFNADITPEQMFIYEHDLLPCSPVQIEGNNIKTLPQDPPSLEKIHLRVHTKSLEKEIEKIEINNEEITGKEKDILKTFIKKFIFYDPDVIMMDYGFSRLPYLVKRLQKHNLHCPFHRWDEKPIKYKGGKSFYSYGNVKYVDFAVRLNGRFLVDTSSTIGSVCEPDAIVELTHLSGTRFQQVASRSFGAAFQQALVKAMIKHNFLVPFKEKPIEQPLTLHELLKADRAGHTLDAKVGLHKNVAEIDFSSLFPWLMYNHNISADTILTKKGPFEQVPGLPIKISRAFKGLVPIALKPFLDRRMYYKKNPSRLNKERAVGLKWVLVSSYGYLRFREFKLGMSTSHMAICAYAREILLKAAHLAEEKGFKVVHGIVDSLYIKKRNIKEGEVKEFCRELELLSGIPVSFEGIFKWIVFLPSINDRKRPLPSTYYGVFQSGEIKARGIDVRRRNTPFIVKYFQQSCLELMAQSETKEEIQNQIPIMCNLFHKVMKQLPEVKADMLASSIRISKIDYKHNVPQRLAVNHLKKKGIDVKPGQSIRYVFQSDGVQLAEDYNGKPDIFQYRKFLTRSLFVLLQPFITYNELLEYLGKERQTKIHEFHMVKHVYVPMLNSYQERKGLSERLLRKRLERQGYEVWRGGALNILKRDEIYPNVKIKYERLFQLLNKHKPNTLETLQYYCHQHGMPDFITFRDKKFKFIEAKLCHEPLSKRQKKCILRLQKLGFEVEVHTLVDHRTKTRTQLIDHRSGNKKIIEKQLVLTR